MIHIGSRVQGGCDKSIGSEGRVAQHGSEPERQDQARVEEVPMAWLTSQSGCYRVFKEAVVGEQYRISPPDNDIARLKAP